MKKKLTSLLLALVMCLTLCAPAFAVKSNPYGETANPIKTLYLENGTKIMIAIVPSLQTSSQPNLKLRIKVF